MSAAVILNVREGERGNRQLRYDAPAVVTFGGARASLEAAETALEVVGAWCGPVAAVRGLELKTEALLRRAAARRTLGDGPGAREDCAAALGRVRKLVAGGGRPDLLDLEARALLASASASVVVGELREALSLLAAAREAWERQCAEQGRPAVATGLFKALTLAANIAAQLGDTRTTLELTARAQELRRQ